MSVSTGASLSHDHGSAVARARGALGALAHTLGLSVPAPSGFCPAQRRDYLLRYGSQTNAYFNLQDGIEHYDLPGVGFISYYRQRAPIRPVNIVFVKPVCADRDLPPLIDRFLEDRGRRTFFAGVDGATAEVLHQRGFTVNDIGVEYTIPIQSYSLSGRKKRNLRSALNNCAQEIEIAELPWSEVDGAAVKRISGEWMSGKQVNDRELRPLTRPPVYGDEWAVRKFYCFKAGRLVAYAFFDPFFAKGRVVGYCANILRAEPDLKPATVLDFAVLTAMKKFKEEGAESLSLGLAPLHDIQPDSRERPSIRWMLEQIYARGSFLYGFKTLAQHKTHYRGEPNRMYACVRDTGPLSTTLATLRAANAI